MMVRRYRIGSWRLGWVAAGFLAPAGAGAGGGGPAAALPSGATAPVAALSMSVEPVGPVERPAAAPRLRVSIRNDGPSPVAVALDQRLADIEFRAGRRRLSCPSPDPIGLAEAGDVRAAVIPPGGAAILELDPSYHCWKKLDRFAGDAARAEAVVRYRVVLVDPSLGGVVGEGAGLSGAATVALGPAGPRSGAAADGEGTAFAVEGADADAARGSDLWLVLTVRNVAGRAVRLVDHPTQFRFRVAGPTGEWECGMGPWRIRPIADLLVRLGARGRYVRRVEMGRYCPAEAFAEPGTYRVEPTYDPYLAERASQPVWDAPVRGEPVAVRIRSGSAR